MTATRSVAHLIVSSGAPIGEEVGAFDPDDVIIDELDLLSGTRGIGTSKRRTLLDIAG